MEIKIIFNIVEKLLLQEQNNNISFFFNPRRLMVEASAEYSRRSIIKAQNERRSFYPFRREYASFLCKIPRVCTCVQNLWRLAERSL